MKSRHLSRLLTVLICSAFSFTATIGVAATFHVAPAPQGNDANDGSSKNPFATLARARDAARAIPNETVTISIGDGTHYLERPLTFTSDDSRSKDFPLVFAAAPDATPVISGGQRLQLKWKPFRDGIFQADVPAGLTFDQLFTSNERQHMARWPNYDPASQYFQGFSAEADAPARVANWSNPTGGFVHAMHRSLWGDMHWRVTGKNDKGELTKEGGWQNNRQMGSHKEYRFVENIFEELDAPGEWYLDDSKSVLYVIPPKNVDLNDAKIEVVRLKHLIEFQGDRANPIRNIELRGLTFTHAARTFMENKEPMLRSDWTTYRGGAILLRGAEDCVIRDCFIDQVGGNGIFADQYNRRVKIIGCHIAGAGASAVSFVGDPASLRSPLFEYQQKNTLEEMDRTPGPKGDNYPSECLVEDCLIYLNGRVEKQTAGVNICMAESITVRKCSIYDCPRAGINVCDGAFGGHLIEYCDVFDTVKETGDHGSFNAWGRDRFWHPDRGQTAEWLKKHPDMPKWDCHKTIVIRNNRWRCDHGWDIDLDDGSSNYELYNNLCLAGGIKLREGYFRNVYNNIMVDYTFCPHVWYPDCHTSFRNNIIFQETYAPAGMKRTDQVDSIDKNLVHRPGGKTAPAEKLAKWASDANSLIGDAKFEDPLAGDYRVKSDSPALQLGFKNFAMDQFGVQHPRLKPIAKTPPLPGTLAAAQVRSGGWGRKYSTPKTAMWLGMELKEIENAGEMSAVGLGDKNGVLIVSVSGANKFNLKANDVIRNINGDSITGLKDFSSKWEKAKTADEVSLELWRDQKTANTKSAAPFDDN